MEQNISKMNIQSLLKTTRTSEWWEYKIPPLLAIAYATMLKGNISFMQASPWLLFLLVSLAFGGAYAHTINDLTDIHEDAISGKRNKMALVPKRFRGMIPFSFFVGGLGFFCVFIYLGDPLSAFIYGLPCVAFSLYSFPPFRLKHRGFLGVLADAFGSHVFISLLMVSSISHFTKQEIDIVWISLVGIWSLLFGIRGILWHQYYDLHNDQKIIPETFAKSTKVATIKKWEKLLFGAEIIFLIGMLFKISLILIGALVMGYVILAYLKYKILGHYPVVILNPEKDPLQILMLDFYQIILPLGLLIYSTQIDLSAVSILILHVLLFPRKLMHLFSDVTSIVKTLGKSVISLNQRIL